MFYGKECNYCYATDDKKGFDVSIKETDFHNHFEDVDSCILWVAYQLFIKADWKFAWDKVEIKGIDYLMEINNQDELIEAMWNTLEDVNTDEDDYIEQNWFVFNKGTDRDDIWHWFDERHSKGVGWLMNEYEPEEYL